MFDNDRSDAETAELVKEWMARHLPVMIAGIVIALLIIFGMRWWEKRGIEAGYRLSYQLDTLEKAVIADDAAAVQAAYSGDLAVDGGNYGAMAALLMAQYQQRQGNQQAALEALAKAETAKDALVAHTAHWQSAQIKMALKDYDGALASLDQLNGSIYAGQLDVLRGDIAYLRGDVPAALKHYQHSYSLQASPLLQTRIRQLELQHALQSAKDSP